MKTASTLQIERETNELIRANSPMKPRHLFGKIWWILRFRPAEFLDSIYEYLLFLFTFTLRQFVFRKRCGIELGRNVRLQRLRCLRAEKPNSRISIGDHSIIYENARIRSYGNGRIKIGGYSILGDVRISCRYQIEIGERCITSWNVFIQDFDPHPVLPEERAQQVKAMCVDFRPSFTLTPLERSYDGEFRGAPIQIGDDVWIGANCTVLKGTEIGDGCIIATGSVVLSGKYPSRSLIAGNPARVVKRI